MAFLAPIGVFLAANAGTISTVLGVASAAVTGVSAIQQGNYQAAVAKNNAVIADNTAIEVAQASQQEQARSDREYAALYGEQLAAQGSSGLDARSRSYGTSRMLTRRVGREAATDIRRQGWNTVTGLQQDAANFRGAAKAASLQGYMTAAGAGLSAAGDIIHQGSLMQRSGGRRPWDHSSSWRGRHS